MSELKPCPFCGKDDGLYSIPRLLEITKEETKEIEWAVGCKRCDVHLYRVRYAKENGFATWNTRPIEDALTAKIAELEEVGQENERAIINAATLFSQAGIGDPDGTLIGIVKNTVKRITELEQENARLREAIEKIREITAEFSYDRKLEQIRDIVNQLCQLPEAEC